MGRGSFIQHGSADRAGAHYMRTFPIKAAIPNTESGADGNPSRNGVLAECRSRNLLSKTRWLYIPQGRVPGRSPKLRLLQVLLSSVLIQTPVLSGPQSRVLIFPQARGLILAGCSQLSGY